MNFLKWAYFRLVEMVLAKYSVTYVAISLSWIFKLFSDAAANATAVATNKISIFK